MKERLDVLLVNLGYAPSREKAKAVIMSGCVYVNGQKEDKAGTMFDTYAAIEVRGNSLKYVSRGGLKLEKAMEEFAIALDQKTCMDVGASTGGFTDCMLQNGAVKVFGLAFSPIKGPEGNIEYLLYLQKTPTEEELNRPLPDVNALVEQSHELL